MATRLILGSLPAVAASFFVLSIAHVGRNALVMQGGAVVLMLAIAGAMSLMPRSSARAIVAGMACAGVLLCALPLLRDGSGPRRWITIGPLSLYIAPVVIPALLAWAAHASRWGGQRAIVPVAGLSVLAFVLAWQPDLSQVLALTVGAAIVIACLQARWSMRLLVLLPFIAAIVLAAGQPDPLSPVPHVEQVIRVSWRHSIVAGVGVSMAAIALVVALTAHLARIGIPLAAVAAYYALLYVCSIADLTPAPLIGYGAGPLLGYGLLAGTAALLSTDRPPSR